MLRVIEEPAPEPTGTPDEIRAALESEITKLLFIRAAVDADISRASDTLGALATPSGSRRRA